MEVVLVVKVRHKEQMRELLVVGGCLSGPMAVMCPPLPRSLMCPLCTTGSFVMRKKKRTQTRSEHKEQERAAAHSAVIEARRRHRVAFRTSQKEVAPNGVRRWISEPPSRAEAAEHLSAATNEIATRTNSEAHQRLDAYGQPWQKPPGMHLCNFWWETWWTDGDRPSVVTFSSHSEGEGGRHYLWMQGPVWAQMRAASLFA